jgi:hypothetical protein
MYAQSKALLIDDDCGESRSYGLPIYDNDEWMEYVQAAAGRLHSVHSLLLGFDRNEECVFCGKISFSECIDFA